MVRSFIEFFAKKPNVCTAKPSPAHQRDKRGSNRDQAAHRRCRVDHPVELPQTQCIHPQGRGPRWRRLRLCWRACLRKTPLSAIVMGLWLCRNVQASPRACFQRGAILVLLRRGQGNSAKNPPCAKTDAHRINRSWPPSAENRLPIRS